MGFRGWREDDARPPLSKGNFARLRKWKEIVKGMEGIYVCGWSGKKRGRKEGEGNGGRMEKRLRVGEVARPDDKTKRKLKAAR